MALQASASLQRCHSNFWICLSKAYRKLREATVIDCGSTSHCRSVRDKEVLAVVLAQTVQLFRPYFTWRVQAGDTAHQDISSCQDASSYEDQDVLSCTETAHRDTTCNAGEKHQDSVAANKTDCARPHLCTVNAADSQAKLCIFSDVCVSQDPSLYVPTLQKLAGKCHAPPVTHELVTIEQGLVPGLNLPLCCYHSPFVMLVRHQLRPDGFEALMETLHREALSREAHQVWASVYVMAECSCLVWAR